MVRNVAPLVAELEPEDFHVLSGIERGMRYSELVDRERIPDLGGLTEKETGYRLERALKRGLIEKRTIQYEGYRLTFEGYDALALHTFATRDTIDGVGAKLGVGKESDVYEARSSRPMALKFHREGIGNFRNLDRERDYTADRRHKSDLYTARVAAEREYTILRSLHPRVSVPMPIDHNRHAIVMEKLEGEQLSRVALGDEEVSPVCRRLFEQAAGAYEAGYIHADLSEYNVFITEDEVVLFDWPQGVSTAHENADDRLRRDVENCLSYFDRKYPGTIPDEVTTERMIDAIVDGTVHDLLTRPVPRED